MISSWMRTLTLWCLFSHNAAAIYVDVGNPASVKAAAKTIASGMLSYYYNPTTGEIFSGVPGYLVISNYYWWECGAMFGALIDYWKYTGDSTYNTLVATGLQFQIGPNADFMPPNASKWMGNDDQGFWALAAMAAAETNFLLPDKGASWLALAQAVFNEQTSRWDTATCGGGMRWQAYSFLAGWALKNSISNGVYFQLGARLARFTGNDTYAQLAARTFDWMQSVNLIDSEWNVFDNSQADGLNCTQVDHNQWTYNAGTMLVGAAYMFNYTNGSAIWQNRTAHLLNRTSKIMFPKGIMTEIVCEPSNVCNTDQDSFKAYLSKWMATTSQLAPFTYEAIIKILRFNAPLAVSQCKGTSTKEAAGLNVGTACGLKWSANGTWDGTDGVGQQMAALEVVLSTLINNTDAPLTSQTGGTSIGAPGAGSSTSPTETLENLPVATKADRAGAGFITAMTCLAVMYGIYYLLSESGEDAARLNAAFSRTPDRTRSEKEKWVEKKKSVAILGAVNESGSLEGPQIRRPPNILTAPQFLPRSQMKPTILDKPKPIISAILIDEPRQTAKAPPRSREERPSVEERMWGCRHALMVVHGLHGAKDAERSRKEYENVRLARSIGNTTKTGLHSTSVDSLPLPSTTSESSDSDIKDFALKDEKRKPRLVDGSHAGFASPISEHVAVSSK